MAPIELTFISAYILTTTVVLTLHKRKLSREGEIAFPFFICCCHLKFRNIETLRNLIDYTTQTYTLFNIITQPLIFSKDNTIHISSYFEIFSKRTQNIKTTNAHQKVCSEYVKGWSLSFTLSFPLPVNLTIFNRARSFRSTLLSKKRQRQ